MAQRENPQYIEATCQQLATALGYELVDAGIEKEGPGLYLRIYLDKPGGITLDDCETFHRAIQPKMERINYDFLEVCSPGLDRPLKTARDFDRHTGARVSVKLYKAIEKRKEFEGELVGLQGDDIVLTTPQGELRFPQKTVSLVRPVVDVSALELAADADDGTDEEA